MRSYIDFSSTRPRLLIAFGAGFLIALLLSHSWSLITRILIGWNVAVWSYLVLVGWLMVFASPAQVRTIAEREDNGAIAMLVIMSIASTLSIAAIVLELVSVKQVTGTLRLVHYVFTVVTVIGAWLLLAVIYTIHYAHLFYRSPSHQRALRFPDNESCPNYWDFLYFSFTIAVAAQTSDINIMSRTMRKAVMAQSVLSFLFNVAIIGMSINIAAGLLNT